MNEFIHKINGVDDKTSLHVVIPHPIVEELGITRGDFVQIRRKDHEIVMRKLLATKEVRYRNSDTNGIAKNGESSDTITSTLIRKEDTIDTGISTAPEFTKQV